MGSNDSQESREEEETKGLRSLTQWKGPVDPEPAK